MKRECDISKEGGRWDDTQLLALLRNLPDGGYTVSVRRNLSRRSGRQNRWLWGCVYPMLLGGLVDAGWELTDTRQVHDLFKSRICRERVVNRHTGRAVEFPNSTANMDTAEFSAYCEKLREYAAEYLGLDIPDPYRTDRDGTEGEG